MTTSFSPFIGLMNLNGLWEYSITSKDAQVPGVAVIGEFGAKYAESYEQVRKYITNPGLSASIYAQITDVETETNRLMNCDRQVIRLDPDLLRGAHEIK